MNSPFPGMDPYMERHWPATCMLASFFTRGNQLQPQLGGSLRARVEERIIVESSRSAARNVAFIQTCAVVHLPRPDRREARVAGAAVAEPLIIERLSESFTEGYVSDHRQR